MRNSWSSAEMKHWKAMTNPEISNSEKNKLLRAIERRQLQKAAGKKPYAKKHAEPDGSGLQKSLSEPVRLFTLAEMRKNGWL